MFAEDPLAYDSFGQDNPSFALVFNLNDEITPFAELCFDKTQIFLEGIEDTVSLLHFVSSDLEAILQKVNWNNVI